MTLSCMSTRYTYYFTKTRGVQVANVGKHTYQTIKVVKATRLPDIHALVIIVRR